MTSPAKPSEASGPTNFIKQIVAADVAAGKNDGRVVTRFPPEPNGYLHIGHAKSICLNFGLAAEFGGVTHLRFDDTDPAKESMEYVASIQEDVRWLGFDWKDKRFFASDYFEQLYDFAVQLIQAGKAYVDHLSADEIREYRGTLTRPGRNSPCRDRSVEENLDLFRRMRAGEFKDGECVLRAKIDMASPNIVMRDPTLYRIKQVSHYRTGDAWCIYPMYDFTHCLSDMIEGITHSICTLEFENNRELYDWVLDALETPCHPQQIEFARLNLNYTVLSKRKLIELVEKGIVTGWDDPRMPTISGYRRRGYTPEAIRTFCERIGVARADSTVDIGLMEHCLREDLNRRAPRVMAVLEAAQGDDRELPGGPDRGARRRQQPGGPRRRHAPGALQPRDLHRTRGLHGGPAQEVLPPGAGAGGAPALRLLHHLRGGRQGPGHRRGDRAALHLRPGHPRRGRARRPQGPGHAALGVGRPRRDRRGAPLRPPLHTRKPRRRRGGPALHRHHQPRVPGGADRLPARAEPRRSRARQPFPVRAHGLLLRGSQGFAAGPAGLQPLRDPARHLGKNRKKTSRKG